MSDVTRILERVEQGDGKAAEKRKKKVSVNDNVIILESHWDAKITLSLTDTFPFLQGHKGRVNGVAFSPDGRLLATASHDGTARVSDLATQRELVQLRSQLTSVYAACFSPDGKRLATGNGDGPVKLYDPARQRELAALGPPLPRGFRVVFFLDDDTIIARAMNEVVVWRATSWPEIETAEKSMRAKDQ